MEHRLRRSNWRRCGIAERTPERTVLSINAAENSASDGAKRDTTCTTAFPKITFGLCRRVLVETGSNIASQTGHCFRRFLEIRLRAVLLTFEFMPNRDFRSCARNPA